MADPEPAAGREKRERKSTVDVYVVASAHEQYRFGGAAAEREAAAAKTQAAQAARRREQQRAAAEEAERAARAQRERAAPSSGSTQIAWDISTHGKGTTVMRKSDGRSGVSTMDRDSDGDIKIRFDDDGKITNSHPRTDATCHLSQETRKTGERRDETAVSTSSSVLKTSR